MRLSSHFICAVIKVLLEDVEVSENELLKHFRPHRRYQLLGASNYINEDKISTLFFIPSLQR